MAVMIAFFYGYSRNKLVARAPEEEAAMVAAAQAEQRVLLIEADLLGPGVPGRRQQGAGEEERAPAERLREVGIEANESKLLVEEGDNDDPDRAVAPERAVPGVLQRVAQARPGYANAMKRKRHDGSGGYTRQAGRGGLEELHVRQASSERRAARTVSTWFLAWTAALAALSRKPIGGPT